MKVDSELLFCQSNIVKNHDLKTFEHNDNNMDTDELKEGKNIMKDVDMGNLDDLKGNRKDADILPSDMTDKDGLWTASEFDSTNATENVVMGFEGSFDRSPKRIESWEKYLDFYAEKRVMDYDMPELIVCYKESTDHDVKDIWIDDGVPSHAKIFFEGSIDGSKDLNTFLAPCQDKDDKLVKGKRDNTDDIIATAKTESLNSTMVDDCSMVFSDQCDFKESENNGAENHIAIENFVNDVSKEKFMPENMPSVQELGTRDSCPESVDYDNIGNNAAADEIADVSEHKSLSEYMSLVQELGTNDAHSESSDNEETGVDHKSSQISIEDTIMVDSEFVSHVDEELVDNMENLVPSRNPSSGGEERESGSITYNFDDSVSAVHSNEESPPKDSGHLVTQSTSELEAGTSDGGAVSNQDRHSFGESSFSAEGPSSSLITSSGQISGCLSEGEAGRLEVMSKVIDDSESLTVLNQLQRGHGESSFSHGESSFSATSNFSGLISYSGAIAYSGNLSMRSDSSTTSTRSFAFPVLQPEWNSSPVRMTKADRRHRWKNRSWKQGLLCCRF